jgi:uncharacterized protein (DUF1015 family)
VPRLSPFRGLSFDETIAGRLDLVTAPPYDVISEDRRLELLRASPFSVVHLDLAEGSADPSDPASRYARAAALLAEWEAVGALRRDADTAHYVYEMAPRAAPPVRGVIAAMRLEDWGGRVLPHEEVMDGPVQDRLALLRATGTHLSPVYGVVDDPTGRMDASVRSAAMQTPGVDVVDEQEVRHRVWRVPGGRLDLSHLEGEPLLIADGHHRYTTALRYRDERRRDAGPGPWDAVMAFVVDAVTQALSVRPFHRVQTTGEAPPPEGEAVPSLEAAMRALSDDDCTLGIATSGSDGDVAYRIRRLAGPPPAVRAAHRELIDRIAPEGSLRYTPDASEADAALRRGDAVAAYLLPPTTPARIRATVERGERLPQKSTCFSPKPRTGMVMMPLTRAAAGLTPRAHRAS